MDPLSNLALGVFVSSHVVTQNQVNFSKPVFRRTADTVVCYGVVNPVPFANFNRHPQNKGLSPDPKLKEIKHAKGVSCLNQCLSVPVVPSAPNVVRELDVGGRLQKYWQKWQELGANPRVVSILKEGYSLPFKMRPPLTRFPLIQSGYANPVKTII